jgi:hypothetical protein
MTDTERTGSNPPGERERWETPAPRQESDAWRGWITFAGAMLILLGAFQVIEGLVALFARGFYAVGPQGLIVSVDYNAWGWLHLIIGVVVIAAGAGILTGQTWARVLGIIFAGLSAIVNLAFLAANPFWAIIIIAVDVVVIYALAVHGREMQT